MMSEGPLRAAHALRVERNRGLQECFLALGVSALVQLVPIVSAFMGETCAELHSLAHPDQPPNPCVLHLPGTEWQCYYPLQTPQDEARDEEDLLVWLAPREVRLWRFRGDGARETICPLPHGASTVDSQSVPVLIGSLLKCVTQARTLLVLDCATGRFRERETLFQLPEVTRTTRLQFLSATLMALDDQRYQSWICTLEHVAPEAGQDLEDVEVAHYLDTGRAGWRHFENPQPENCALPYALWDSEIVLARRTCEEEWRQVGRRFANVQDVACAGSCLVVAQRLDTLVLDAVTGTQLLTLVATDLLWVDAAWGAGWEEATTACRQHCVLLHASTMSLVADGGRRRQFTSEWTQVTGMESVAISRTLAGVSLLGVQDGQWKCADVRADGNVRTGVLDAPCVAWLRLFDTRLLFTQETDGNTVVKIFF